LNVKTSFLLAVKNGFLLVISCLLLGMNAQAALDSKGTEFWIMFPSNYQASTTLTLFITGETNTSGTVSIPGLGFSTSFSVTAGVVTSVNIPANAQATGSDAIESKGIRIVSNAEVTVYGLNRIPFTTDAFLALPTDILGTNYINLGYKNTNVVNATEFGIVATANATTVTITPSVTTGARVAGVAYTITLNQGQTYQLVNTGSAPNDLSGTLITSNKPIGVLGGHGCANIPPGAAACDHVVEMLPPTDAWGKNFVTVPLKTRTKGDTFRFLATEDGTSVTVNGTVVATLNRGKLHETILTAASQITATKPILVAQYSNGTTFDNVTSDPFMMLVPPFEQFLGQYTVTTPASGFSGNYINVVAPQAALGTIKLDGVTIPNASFTPIGSSGFWGAQLTVSLGSHNLNSTALPFGVFVYGFDNADSYGYPGGQSLAPIAVATTLVLAPKSGTTTVGSSLCLTATVRDQNAQPVVGVRVDFSVTGANPTAGFVNTNANGVASFCYTGTQPGTDQIVASLGTLTDNATRTWIGQDKLNQTITFAALPDKTYGDAAFSLSATASSGLPVSFSIVSGPGSLNGNLLSINGAGQICVRASQAGNATYNPAPPVDRCFMVGKAVLTAKADDKTRPVGAANPPFTISYSGFVNGDNAGVIDTPPTASTTATLASPAGTYPIVLIGGSDNNYSFVLVNGTLTVTESPAECQATGTILREYWANVLGNQTSQVPINKTPTSTSQLTLFEAPSNVAENYASRIRGYICPPTSGAYTFWIASDDYGDLYLSTDDDPANKQLIAYIRGWSLPRQWNKHSSQQSAPITLEAGKKYYIEALHKEAWVNDNLAVGWRLPDGTLERPIAGSRLSPFVPETICSATGTLQRELWTNVPGDLISQIPVNTEPNSTSQVTSFEGPVNVGDQYGARYRGYLCIRESGGYRFWVASDNTSELWLSSDEDPANKVRIAYQLEGYNNTPRQWFKFGSQQSALIQLEAGKSYFIEALHKEGTGSDFLSVGWRMPSASGNSTPQVIPGSYLSPYGSGNARMEVPEEPALAQSERLTASPNPFSHQVRIDFVPQTSGTAQLDLFDLRGARMKNLYNGEVEAEQSQRVEMESAGLTEGMYIVRMVNGGQVRHLKLILSR